jgi:hypothetical protein
MRFPRDGGRRPPGGTAGRCASGGKVLPGPRVASCPLPGREKEPKHRDPIVGGRLSGAKIAWGRLPKGGTPSLPVRVRANFSPRPGLRRRRGVSFWPLGSLAGRENNHSAPTGSLSHQLVFQLHHRPACPRFFRAHLATLDLARMHLDLGGSGQHRLLRNPGGARLARRRRGRPRPVAATA